MRIIDWSSDVCSSDLGEPEGDLVVVVATPDRVLRPVVERVVHPAHVPLVGEAEAAGVDGLAHPSPGGGLLGDGEHAGVDAVHRCVELLEERDGLEVGVARSEEHTSELQSLMRISYAVFCLKKTTRE